MSLELSVFPFSWFNRSTNYEFRRLLYDARFEQCLVQCTFVIRVDNIKCKYPYIVYSPTLFFCQLLKWNDLFRFEVGIPTWMSCSTIWHFRRMAIDATVYANPISFYLSHESNCLHKWGPLASTQWDGFFFRLFNSTVSRSFVPCIRLANITGDSIYSHSACHI